MPHRFKNSAALEEKDQAQARRSYHGSKEAVTLLPKRVLIPLIVACGLFMENLDSTVLSTSLPAIAADIHVDPISLKLALTSYLISLAIFVPISGWVADKYGARRVFMAAISVFMAGSALCSLSGNLPEFVFWRIIQGLGGAMMVPVGRLVILRTVAKSEMVNALAWLTIPALTGPLIGPPLGGFITTYLDWRWIFYINLPVGALGLLLTQRFIPNIREAHTPSLDRKGFVLSGIGLSSFVFGLALLGESAHSLSAGFVLTALGLAFCALYIRHARRVEHPVIELRLLRIPTFRAGVLGALFFRVGVGAIPFLLPLMLQLEFGLSPFESGLTTFAAAAGSLVMKTTAAPILRAFGFRRVLILNAIVCVGFLAANGLFTPSTPHALIVGVLLVGGFFRSLEFTAVNAIAYADIRPANMSRATSFASVSQQVALSLGVAIAGLILQAARNLSGRGEIALIDFSIAFWIVSAISAISILFFVRLPRSAGAELAAPSRASSITAVTPKASAADPRGEATAPQ